MEEKRGRNSAVVMRTLARYEKKSVQIRLMAVL